MFKELRMFADLYLAKNNHQPLIAEPAERDVSMIVVIPCFREPEITETLESLAICTPPAGKAEVIILFNHPEDASDEIKESNISGFLYIANWVKQHDVPWLHFLPVQPVNLQKKWAGAGLARKRGMDEAIYRFNRFDNHHGIIVSLDADTLVSENYFSEIENHFIQNPENAGATIPFLHREENLSPRHLEGIRLYEKYLHYYRDALEYTGYPHAMFTVGSAFAVTAGAYVKRGGMNRRQAGEDFYFLQNLTQVGKVGIIRSAMVFPSARLSDRVPFGTGPIMKKWVEGSEDLAQTYNFSAFTALKSFFSVKDMLYKSKEEEYISFLRKIPEPVAAFLEQDNFWEEVNGLSNNCSSPEIFRGRFYQIFNAFKILKFLNFAHGKFYGKANLDEQYRLLKNTQ